MIVSCQPRDSQPPAIHTSGLDPAVATLIETALQEVRAAPRSGDAWGKLGSVLMHYEFMDETKAAFERAEKLSPREPRWPHLHGLAISARDVAAATEKFRRAASLAGEQPDAPRLRLAQTLAERGLNEEAEAQFHTLLRLTPNHPPALLGLARLHHAQGRLAEANNQLAGCLRDPHTARSAYALLSAIEQAQANAERGTGNAELFPASRSPLPVSPRADAAARASASLPADVPWPDPWWSEAFAFRVGRKAVIEDATTLMDQGRLTEALVALDRATLEYPQDEEAWYLLGWAWNQRGTRSAERGAPEDSAFRVPRSALPAERALREHLRLSPESPKGHAQLAVALLTQQRHAEAVEVLQAALKLKPTWRELHSNLGYACVQLGRDDEAIGHFRDALTLDPNYLPTYTALAELLGRHGGRDEARRLLQQAVELEAGR